MWSVSLSEFRGPGGPKKAWEALVTASGWVGRKGGRDAEPGKDIDPAKPRFPIAPWDKGRREPTPWA